MKKYIVSKIKKVFLDADQAVLEVCQVGGAYWMASFGGLCGLPGGAGTSCITSIRGASANTVDIMTGDSQPS